MRFAFLVTVFLSPAFAAAERLSWRHEPPVSLESGDLVFRKGYGFWTPYFINASSREKRFSHVGVAVEMHGDVALVHADANEQTGYGFVRLENWASFFGDALECAVFRYEGSAKERAGIAKCAAKRMGVPFDPLFDMADTNKLYCTELVRLAVNEALGTNLIGYTILCGHKIVAIDDLYKNKFKRIFDSK